MASGSSDKSWWALLRNWLFISVGVLLASFSSDGISYESQGWLLFAAALIGVFNTFLKPILVLFSLPFILLTLGMGLLVVNALIFGLVGTLLPGFHVAGFWAAIWGGFVVSLSSMLLEAFTGKRSSIRVNVNRNRAPRKPARSRRVDDDVIDI